MSHVKSMTDEELSLRLHEVDEMRRLLKSESTDLKKELRRRLRTPPRKAQRVVEVRRDMYGTLLDEIRSDFLQKLKSGPCRAPKASGSGVPLTAIGRMLANLVNAGSIRNIGYGMYELCK